MPCYRPIQVPKKGFVDLDVTVPCGQCVGCRLERSRQWAVRCLHEAQMHVENCYITLTYRDACLPPNGSLVYRDFQLFLKRLRERFARESIRFYMCGEYGDENRRPHFHALLFGFDFPDKQYLKRSPAGESLYRSAILESLWTFGYSSIGAVTFESAAYVARYVMKKRTGDLAKTHYTVVDRVTGEVTNLEPEFNRMSLGGRSAKGGIGASWFQRFRTDVYPSGKVVVRGVECKAPRYYDKLFTVLDPESFALVSAARVAEARARASDNVSARRGVKEVVAQARIDALKRKL